MTTSYLFERNVRRTHSTPQNAKKVFVCSFHLRVKSRLTKLMRLNTFVLRVQHLSRKAMGNNVENINHQQNISLITWRQNSKTGCKAFQYLAIYPIGCFGIRPFDNKNHQRNISHITWRQNSKTGCKAHQYVTYYLTSCFGIRPIDNKNRRKNNNFLGGKLRKIAEVHELDSPLTH